MKKVSLILSAVVMTAMMLNSCGEGASNEESASNEVTIGKQVWMSENLNVDKFRNGDPIPQAKTDAEWQKAGENEQAAWCYYDNDPSNGTKYGKLYNWYAVNDPRGLAPNGYHIPTDAEWTKLSDYLGGEDLAGTKMKSKSGWGEIGNGTNSSGFSGLPGGGRYNSGNFGFIGQYGHWWISTENSSNNAWLHRLDYNNASEYSFYEGKELGLSVRCVRDETSPPTTYNLNLEVNPTGAGTVTGAGNYEAGEPVNLNAEANTGWEFVNWTDEDNIEVSNGANFVYTMPEMDVTLTANFTSQTLNIGDFYQGGIIAYILQPGDPGYVEGEFHGIIAAPSDLGNYAPWGCYDTSISGADGTALGTGYQNTLAIVAGCGTAGIAARICNDFELNGYSDWYLPSMDELNKLYLSKYLIGGFLVGNYWSSSEYNGSSAWGQVFGYGEQGSFQKSNSLSVRAVRTF